MATRTLAATFVLLATLIAPCAVQAHAFIDHSNPAVGSTLPTAPKVVHIWFTQELEPAFSWIQVTNKSGAAVNDGSSFVDASNNQEMDIKLKPLPAGTYTVKWHALSVDTHTTHGEFTFQVQGS
ncbi:MAG: copper resistance protein CopC [Candidatus Eremiobacteraeota bacterium]|nr:copper resistance protein CopC [Candidatus Eremiobacteraeota bacterium]